MSGSRSRVVVGTLGVLSILLSLLVFRAALLPPVLPTPSPALTTGAIDDHGHGLLETPTPLFGGNSGLRRSSPIAGLASPVPARPAELQATPQPPDENLIFAPARFQATPERSGPVGSATPASR